jgi:nucleoid DNA-binding protein
MAKNKTTETEASVSDFLTTVTDEKRRKDCLAIVDLITESTGLEPKMWGASIIGFGSYHYKYESGREGNAPLTGIAARANAIVLYLSAHFDERETLLATFGKHKTGKGCIYIQKLEDIDTNVLIKMVKNSIEHVKSIYPD